MKNIKNMKTKHITICALAISQLPITQKKGKFVLNPSAIPSIFNDQNEFDKINYSNEDDVNGVSKQENCAECPPLFQKIKDLEQQILLVKAEHNK